MKKCLSLILLLCVILSSCLVFTSCKHACSFDDKWTADSSYHWHACTECMGKGDVAAHEYDDLCDADCNICGMTRQPEHEAPGDWAADETGHWFTCEACKQKRKYKDFTIWQ